MNFDDILKYQEIDKRVFDIEQELASSEERKQVAIAKQKLDIATDMVKRLTMEAIEVENNRESITKNFQKVKEQMTDLEKSVDGIDDCLEEQVDFYIKTLNSLQDSMESLNREINRDAQKVDDIEAREAKAWEQGKLASQMYRAALEKYNTMKAEKDVELVKHNATLEKLQAKIDAKSLEIYKSLRAQKRLPAYVEYDVNSKRCSGCRMDIAADTIGKLKKAGDWTECPNCRRILFVK